MFHFFRIVLKGQFPLFSIIMGLTLKLTLKDTPGRGVLGLADIGEGYNCFKSKAVTKAQPESMVARLI